MLAPWRRGTISHRRSYFHGIRDRLERDLQIRGATLRFETPAAEEAYLRDDDDWEHGGGPDEQFQSYHVIFLAPNAQEFRFEDETEVWDRDPLDPDVEEPAEKVVPGEGWIGCAAGVSLAAPFAVLNLTRFARYEDGSESTPDVECFIYSAETEERLNTDRHYRQVLGEKVLGQKAFQALDALRAKIAAVLAKHHLRVLESPIAETLVPGLKPSEEVFLQAPLRVRDAFFFRGI